MTQKYVLLLVQVFLLLLTYYVTNTEEQEHIVSPDLQSISEGLTKKLVSNDPVGNERDSMNIQAVDSDYFMLYTNRSGLNDALVDQDVGMGVFAKIDIPKNMIICEYRGPIIQASDFYKMRDFDKAYAITGPDGKDYKILGDTLCAKINDCSGALAKPLHVDEFIAMNDTGVPCYDGFEYNAVPLSQPNGKMFIVSKRDINAGEEIFHSYS